MARCWPLSHPSSSWRAGLDLQVACSSAVRCAAVQLHPRRVPNEKGACALASTWSCQESMGQAQQSLCCEKIPTPFHTQRPTPKAQLHAPGQPAAITKGYAKYYFYCNSQRVDLSFHQLPIYSAFSSASFQLESNTFFQLGCGRARGARSQEPGADSVDQPSNR